MFFDFIKYRRLSWLDRALLLEAFLFVMVASIAIAMLPFRKLGTLAGRPVTPPEPSQQARSLIIKRTRWAVVAVATRVPWRALCFQQGLAAQLMLRRRGVASVLYYGALQDRQKGLQAHVWVQDGVMPVVGCELASHYAVLARFPPQDSPAAAGRLYGQTGR